MFFRLFFRLSAHFRPHSSAIFHPNTPHNFLLPLSAYDKWWFEQKKKSPHFQEKCLVLSYSRVRFRRTQGLEPQPAGVLIFQNLAILFLFRTPNERDVRTFEETSTRTNTHDINWNYAVVAENATLHGVNFVVEAMSKQKTPFACGVTSVNVLLYECACIQEKILFLTWKFQPGLFLNFGDFLA